MQFRKYVELRRAMLSGAAWSREHDKLGANVLDGGLNSEKREAFSCNGFERCMVQRAIAELCVFVWDGALSSKGILTSVQWLGV
jgi:hypothetical protein